MTNATDTTQAALNEWQQKIFASISEPVNGSSTISFPFPLGALEIVCLERFIYTIAISIYSSPYNRRTRFCYPDFLTAWLELEAWAAKNFEGKPENYIKQKPEGDW